MLGARTLSTLWSQVGPLALAMAGLGLADTIVRGTKAPPWQSGFAALFLSVWIFQTLVPAALQDRYLVPLLPPLFLLALRGIEISAIFAAKRVPIVARSNRSVTASLVLIVAATMMPAALAVQAKQHVGYVEAAQTVWSHRIAANPSVLIVTNNSGEGTAIAELAMLDPARPSLFAVRGSRLLGGGGYNAQDYLPRFQTLEQVMEAIDSYNIPLVLIRPDPSAAAWAHIGQVVEAQHLYPERWELLYHGASGISVYRLRGNAEKTGDTAKLAALSAPKALGE